MFQVIGHSGSCDNEGVELVETSYSNGDGRGDFRTGNDQFKISYCMKCRLAWKKDRAEMVWSFVA